MLLLLKYLVLVLMMRRFICSRLTKLAQQDNMTGDVLHDFHYNYDAYRLSLANSTNMDIPF